VNGHAPTDLHIVGNLLKRGSHRNILPVETTRTTRSRLR
jgi:hypothetical protein